MYVLLPLPKTPEVFPLEVTTAEPVHVTPVSLGPKEYEPLVVDVLVVILGQLEPNSPVTDVGLTVSDRLGCVTDGCSVMSNILSNASASVSPFLNSCFLSDAEPFTDPILKAV